LRTHIVGTGVIYGNGELENCFYEHFRRAWLSLHPRLAELPVVGDGSNRLPTIHAHDLAQFVNIIIERKPTQQYLVATDFGRNSQLQIIKAISESLGSGTVKHFDLGEIFHEPWAENLSLDLRIRPSKVITQHIEAWRCKDGLTSSNIRKVVNDEFNRFRGLFPLKLFVSGPPGSGKTHFCSLLAKDYGIPHITVKDAINLGLSLKNELG